jgi:hypothetical protein
VLADRRTDAEWRFVGVPDLTAGREVVYGRNRTDGRNRLVDDLVAGRHPRRPVVFLRRSGNRRPALKAATGGSRRPTTS